MAFQDRIKTVITELTDKGESKTAIAEAAGLSKGIVNQWEDGLVKSIKLKAALGIEKRYGYSHVWLILGTGEKMVADRKEIDLDNDNRWEPIKFVEIKIRAGVTGYAVEYLSEDEFEPLFFKKTWFQRRKFDPTKLYALMIKGNSMDPTLGEGSVVVINTEDTEIKDNEIYAINYHGEPVVKRIVSDIGGYWLVSDNADQRRFARVKCDEDTSLIGRVVHHQGEF